ncbi:MAG: SDR family NAD(P)-dependent oxidoreductase [Planctomycetota bacterium]
MSINDSAIPRRAAVHRTGQTATRKGTLGASGSALREMPTSFFVLPCTSRGRSCEVFERGGSQRASDTGHVHSLRARNRAGKSNMADTNSSWTVITGSTGGIGSELAKQLVQRGDSLVLVNRSKEKADAQRASLIASHPGASIELVTADLMDVAQIVAAASTIESIPGTVDALYNNSGILTGEKVLSAQGFESQFAVNTLAPYVLIRRLRGKLARPRADGPAMVVNFSSSAIKAPKSLDVDNLSNPDEVGGLMTTYAQTKLAATALAPALEADLKADNILIRAIDPGATRSPMTTTGNSGMPRILSWIAPLLFRPADQQAAKVIESAAPAALGGRSGVYVANRRVRPMPAPAADEDVQRRLIVLLDRILDTESHAGS